MDQAIIFTDLNRLFNTVYSNQYCLPLPHNKCCNMEAQDVNSIITIYSEATPNPETMKFVLNKMIFPNDSVDFPQKESAGPSPLAQKLFEFDYIKGVFIMNNFVTVTKGSNYEWFDLVPQLKEFIKSYVESGEVIVDQDALVKEQHDESEIVNQIKEILDTHVKPAVEMDGGAISFPIIQ